MQCLPQYNSINSRLVLIVRLICHDEKVYEKKRFCKSSKYKSQLHFPSHNNRTCTKLTYKQFATINPSTKKKLNLWDFSLPLAFSFNKSDVNASRNFSRNAAIHEYNQGVSPNFLTIKYFDSKQSSEIQAKEWSN